MLFGLRLADGGVAVRTNVDPPNRLVEQERGALLDFRGRIYVPYGGLFGDCGDFHGYVVSTKQGGGSRIAYRNPSREAGIWSPGGVVAQSSTPLVSTGNGGGGRAPPDPVTALRPPPLSRPPRGASSADHLT